MSLKHGTNRWYPRSVPGDSCWREYTGSVCGLTRLTDSVAIGGTVMAGDGEKVRITGGGLLIDDVSTALNYLELGDGVTAPVSIGTKGRLRYNNVTATFQISVSGSPYVDLAVGASAGPWDRTGTIVHLDFSTDNVGIGTAVPGAKLRVLNDVAVQSALIVEGALAQSADILQVRDSGATPLFIVDDTGQVIIGGPAAVGAELLRVVGAARIEGKLTVTGVIDPTALILSGGGTAHFIEYAAGSTAAVGAATTMRFRYEEVADEVQVSLNAAAYVPITTGVADAVWDSTGTIVHLVTFSDTVAIGIATMVGPEKVRIFGVSPLRLDQAATLGGAPPAALLVVGGAHGLIDNAEVIDVDFALDRTIDFASTATLAEQRAIVMRPPTYSSSLGAKVITQAATLAIAGAPVAGSNVTYTNGPFSLWVQQGQNLLARSVVGGATGLIGTSVEVDITSGTQSTIASALSVQALTDGASVLSSTLVGTQSLSLHSSTGAAAELFGLFAAAQGSGAGRSLGTIALATGIAASVGYNPFDLPTIGIITDGFALLAESPSGIAAGRTVVNATGVRIENQGGSGVTNAVGLDILAQSGAATLNLGARFAAPIRMLDDIQLRFGTTDDVTAEWLNATSDLLVNNTVVTGSTIFRLGTTTVATDFQVQDSAGIALFTVFGSGKVTIPGTLDPTDILLSGGGTAHFIQYAGGSTAAVSDASTMRFRYDEVGDAPEVSLNGAAYVALSTGAGAGGSLELIERKIITADTGSVTFSGLDGEADAIYAIFGSIKKTSGFGATGLEMRPNGLITNQLCDIFTPPSSEVGPARLTIVLETVLGKFTSFDAIFHARKTADGVGRGRIFRCFMLTNTGTLARGKWVSGWWDDTTTTVTSLVFTTDSGAAEFTIGKGSTISLYRIKQT